MTEIVAEPVLAIFLEPGDPAPDSVEPGTQVFRRVEVAIDGSVLPDGCLGRHWPEADTCSEHNPA